MVPETEDLREAMKVVHQYLLLLRTCGDCPVHPRSMLTIDADAVKRAPVSTRRALGSDAVMQAAREVGGDDFAAEVSASSFGGRLLEACRNVASFIPDDQAALVRNYWTHLLAAEQSFSTFPLAALSRAEKSEAIAIKARAAVAGDELVDEFLRQVR